MRQMPVQFLAMVVAGLARAGIDVGPLEALAEQGFADVPVAAAVAALASALAGRDVPAVLFVDDIHRLTRDAVQEVLVRLIAECPPCRPIRAAEDGIAPRCRARP